MYDNDESYVFKLVGEDRVERVRVDPLLQGVHHVEARSGFAVGDRVVIAGQIGLKDKARVDAKPAATPSSLSAASPTASATTIAPTPEK